jgi:hypothetical protein
MEYRQLINNKYSNIRKDRLCGLVVRVPGYRTEIDCDSCEVRTEFIYVMYESRPPLWSSDQSSWLHNGNILCFLWGTNRIYICYVEESRPPQWSSGQSSWLQNGDVLCFLWGTNWIYVCYVEEIRPRLWSSGQSSWLQIQRSGFDSQLHQIFWEVVGLCRGPHSLVNTRAIWRQFWNLGHGTFQRPMLANATLWNVFTLWTTKITVWLLVISNWRCYAPWNQVSHNTSGCVLLVESSDWCCQTWGCSPPGGLRPFPSAITLTIQWWSLIIHTHYSCKCDTPSSLYWIVISSHRDDDKK